MHFTNTFKYELATCFSNIRISTKFCESFIYSSTTTQNVQTMNHVRSYVGTDLLCAGFNILARPDDISSTCS